MSDDDLTKGGSRHICAFLSMPNPPDSAARLNIPSTDILDYDAVLPHHNILNCK